jgi:chromosome segregation ATPase
VIDLAALRDTVEEIASKQQQTSRDIASIQAAEQNLSKQISSLARANPIAIVVTFAW